MSHFIAALIVAFVSFGAFVQLVAQTGAVYTATEAANHIGESATVTDKVDSVHQSGKGNIFLNMGGKYPRQAFTAFIPAASSMQFPRANEYQGRVIAVLGKIELYHGKPEIVVTSPNQIFVKE